MIQWWFLSETMMKRWILSGTMTQPCMLSKSLNLAQITIIQPLRYSDMDLLLPSLIGFQMRRSNVLITNHHLKVFCWSWAPLSSAINEVIWFEPLLCELGVLLVVLCSNQTIPKLSRLQPIQSFMRGPSILSQLPFHLSVQHIWSYTSSTCIPPLLVGRSLCQSYDRESSQFYYWQIDASPNSTSILGGV